MPEERLPKNHNESKQVLPDLLLEQGEAVEEGMIKPSTLRQYDKLVVLMQRMTLKQAAYRIHISYESARQIVSRCHRDRRMEERETPDRRCHNLSQINPTD